jgi:hypothetical protein
VRPINDFAGEATYASLEVKIIQVHQLGIGLLGSSAFKRLCQQGHRIPFFSRASVDSDDRHISGLLSDCRLLKRTRGDGAQRLVIFPLCIP